MQLTTEEYALIGLITVLIVLFYAIPLIIIFSLLVRKAGKPVWPQIIPIWNYYVIGIVAKRPKLAIAQAAIYVVFLATRGLGSAVIGNLLSFAWLVIGLIILNSFVRQFDASVGKWILYILLPIVGVFFVRNTTYTGGDSSGSLPTAPLV